MRDMYKEAQGSLVEGAESCAFVAGRFSEPGTLFGRSTFEMRTPTLRV
jgi:hypothetical protein